MVARAEPFVDHCLELLAPLGAVRAKRMFGGHGLYLDDLMFALIAEALYLKVDAESRPRFDAAGCRPFIYDAKSQAVAMSYWSAPDDAMESPHAMLPWARAAVDAALRARAAKATKGTRRKARPSAAPAAATSAAPSRARPATKAARAAKRPAARKPPR